MERTEDSRDPSILVVPAVDSVSQSSMIGSAAIGSEKGLIHSGVLRDEIIEHKPVPKLSTQGLVSKPNPIFGNISHPVHNTMRKIGAMQLEDERKPAYYHKVLERRQHARTQSVPTALREKTASAYSLITPAGYISIAPATIELHEGRLEASLLKDPRVRRAHGLDGRPAPRALGQPEGAYRSISSKLAPRPRFPQASDAAYYSAS